MAEGKQMDYSSQTNVLESAGRWIWEKGLEVHKSQDMSVFLRPMSRKVMQDRSRLQKLKPPSQGWGVFDW